MSLAHLEAILLQQPAIEDCAVLSRVTESGVTDCLTYVVASRLISCGPLCKDLAELVPDGVRMGGVVQVSNIQRDAHGDVDEGVLHRIVVIDGDLEERVKSTLRSLPGIKQFDLKIAERIPSVARLHLSDILPAIDSWQKTNARAPKQRTDDETTTRKPAQKMAFISGSNLVAEPLSTTLPATLERACHVAPKNGVVFSGNKPHRKSYAELRARSQRILGGLRARRVEPKQVVLIFVDDNWDFLSAIWACLLGGVVPLPIGVSNSTAKEMALTKLTGVWREFNRPPTLVNARVRTEWFEQSSSFRGRLLSIEDLERCDPHLDAHRSKPNDLALLLLTSGSSGTPKAVKHSHQSILNRTRATIQTNHFTQADCSLNWMPLDHVGGLVMFHLRDVYAACNQVHVETNYVLQSPRRWLDLLTEYRATNTWAPNFAFGLINGQLTPETNGPWDLSSVRFIMNAGEPIIDRTVKQFMKSLASFGLRGDVLHPAWGMSETASAVIFSKSFDVHSLAGDGSTVPVGKPVPGLSVRVVDPHDRVLAEGETGSLQVKGAMLTPGYYRHPDATRQLFGPDGWLRTGDLAVIRNAQVTIIGREKDAIILNGINYANYEIEQLVSNVEGVSPGQSIVIAVRDPSDDSEGIALFFVPDGQPSDQQLLRTMQSIRSRLANAIGLHPKVLLPIDASDIPRSSIGKIQRSRLAERLADGELDAVLKRMDLLQENRNTIPDWFFKPIWCRQNARRASDQTSGGFLIFADRGGIADVLSKKLKATKTPYALIEIGTKFQRLASYHFRLDPDNLEHYSRLLSILSERNFHIGQIVHLWSHEDDPQDVATLDELLRLQKQGLYSVLHLVQAIDAHRNANGHRPDMTSIELIVVTKNAQAVQSAESNRYVHAGLIGLVHTIDAEFEYLGCRHVDLPSASNEDNASALFDERFMFSDEREIAYRDGKRWVARLQRLPFDRAKNDPPFKRHGMYLMTGGLGGIGMKLSAYLLREYDANLLIVGRTDLDAEKQHAEPFDAKTTQRRERLQELQAMGGQVEYVCVDLGGTRKLQDIVEQTESIWDCQLHGILHLAGVDNAKLLIHQDRQTLNDILRPKLAAISLSKLLASRSDCFFVGFSSVIARFGGVTMGAYAAANRFLEHLITHLKSRGFPAYCYGWSSWENLGLSSDFQGSDLLRAKGYMPISVSDGIRSLLIGYRHDVGLLIVGLDGTNRHIRRYVDRAPFAVQELVARCIVEDSSDQPSASIQIPDRYGNMAECKIQKRRGAEGQIENQASPVVTSDNSTKRSALRDAENAVFDVWSKTLGLHEIGARDNFFDLGGNSVLLMQVSADLERSFGKPIRVTDLFEHPTVESLAQYLAEPAATVDSSLIASHAIGVARRDRIRSRRRKKQDRAKRGRP